MKKWQAYSDIVEDVLAALIGIGGLFVIVAIEKGWIL